MGFIFRHVSVCFEKQIHILLFSFSFGHSCICIYFSNIYILPNSHKSFFFVMHGWGLMKGHFGVISEYCKTGLLVIFNVTVRRGLSVRFCRPLCSFRWHSSKSFVMHLPVYTRSHPLFFVGMCPCSKFLSTVRQQSWDIGLKQAVTSSRGSQVVTEDYSVTPLSSTPTLSLTLSYSQVSSPASARQRAALTCCSSASINALTHVSLLGLRVARHHV